MAAERAGFGIWNRRWGRRGFGLTGHNGEEERHHEGGDELQGKNACGEARTELSI